HLVGFLHSEIPGSKPACGSPRLIAACQVLHRLLAPRHPPYALSSLIIKLTQLVDRGSATVLTFLKSGFVKQTLKPTHCVPQLHISRTCDWVNRKFRLSIPRIADNE